LPFHSDNKEDHEVDNKDRPEHWNIEYIKKCTKQGNEESPCYIVPKNKEDIKSLNKHVE
jgi:purine nucleoside permease